MGEGMRQANYRFIYNNDDAIMLEDIGPWDVHPTITNDAEQVVERLAVSLYNGKHLYYVDSSGDTTELLHKDGKFTGFSNPQ